MDLEMIILSGESESVSHSVVSDSVTSWSVHGILQPRILEWIAILFSRKSSWPRDQTWVSYTALRFLYHLSYWGSSVLSQISKQKKDKYLYVESKKVI